MTFITIALVVLASGWLFSRTWLRSRYMALKEAGHPQYFAAAIAGVWLMALAASLRKAITSISPLYSALEHAGIGLLPQGIVTSESQSADFEFAACAMWCLVLSVFIPWLLNLPLRHDKALLRAVLKRAGAFDAIEHIMTHALDCGLPIAVTLKNKKVYVGAPISVSPIETERKWLVLFPILSGSRDDQSKLSLTVNYGEVYEKFQKDHPDDATRLINEFRVVLSVAEIVSVQTFNIETYYKKFDGGTVPSTPAEGWLVTVTNGEHGSVALAKSLTPEEIKQCETVAVSGSQAAAVVAQETTDQVAGTVDEELEHDAPETDGDAGVDGGPQEPVDAFTPEQRVKMRYYYAYAMVLTFAILALSLLPAASLPLLMLAAIMAQASLDNGHMSDTP